MCNGSGKFRGWDYSSDARPTYLLYFALRMHENTEVDALGEHQLKWTQSGSSKLKLTQSGTAAEANAVGKQQLERMQSGRSSV